MLLEALSEAEAQPDQTLMVGFDYEDREAASAAGKQWAVREVGWVMREGDDGGEREGWVVREGMMAVREGGG